MVLAKDFFLRVNRVLVIEIISIVSRISEEPIRRENSNQIIFPLFTYQLNNIVNSNHSIVVNTLQIKRKSTLYCHYLRNLYFIVYTFILLSNYLSRDSKVINYYYLTYVVLEQQTNNNGIYLDLGIVLIDAYLHVGTFVKIH